MLKIENVAKKFSWSETLIKKFISKLTPKTQKIIWAVNNVSLDINKGECVGVIGESGCGKTTLARIILRLFPYIDKGKVKFGNSEICVYEFSKKQIYEYRRRVQMVFQHPEASLNPHMSIGKNIKEAIMLKSKGKGISKKEINDLIRTYLVNVLLNPEYIHAYPHELSGGEKRRIGLIRALSVEPDLVICDEPFSGLDAPVRNHIIELLKNKLQEGLSLLLISHDIGVVKTLCSKVAVMYLGRIVEIGDVKKVISEEARHPYTKELFSASNYQPTNIGDKEPEMKRKNYDSCLFHDRCKSSKKRCREETPLLESISENHSVACHYWNR
ncbi:MAG: ABC transporter ATP-binding protein [bacterium]